MTEPTPVTPVDAEPAAVTERFSGPRVEVDAELRRRLAATGATERPAGESHGAQEQRIITGINRQLANTKLATAGEWNAIWVGLTANRANLAYIVKNSTGSSPLYALCLRGTVADSPIPFAPMGWCGEGVTVWPVSQSGTSSAVGMR